MAMASTLCFSVAACSACFAFSTPSLKNTVTSCHQFANISESKKSVALDKAAAEATHFGLSVSASFFPEKELKLDATCCSAQEFDKTFQKYYAGLRKKQKDGVERQVQHNL